MEYMQMCKELIENLVDLNINGIIMSIGPPQNYILPPPRPSVDCRHRQNNGAS